MTEHTIDEYQANTFKTAYYPNAGRGTAAPDAIEFLIDGMADEVQEIDGDWYEHSTTKMYENTADLLWYIARFADENNWKMSELMAFSMSKAQGKYEAKKGGEL